MNNYDIENIKENLKYILGEKMDLEPQEYVVYEKREEIEMVKLRVLNEFDILELINRQKLLDEKFTEKNKNNNFKRKKELSNVLIAMNTELGELMQETKKFWNYWKINCNFSKNRTLEELSDYLHFLLQYFYFNDDVYDIIKDEELEINSSIEFIRYDNMGNSNTTEDINIDKYLLELVLPISYNLTGKTMGLKEIISLFISISNILLILDSNWGEFLTIHHKKFEKNYYDRTREEY